MTDMHFAMKNDSSRPCFFTLLGFSGMLLLLLPGVTQARNVILFVADGLRQGSVNDENAPTMNELRARGVFFSNSHSLYPTLTTPNSAAIATGHYTGDAGDLRNTEDAGFPVLHTRNLGRKW